MFGIFKNPYRMARRQLRKHWGGQLPVGDEVLGKVVLRYVDDLESNLVGFFMVQSDGQLLIVLSSRLSENSKRFTAAFLLGMMLQGRKTAFYADGEVMLEAYGARQLRWANQFACALLVPERQLEQLLVEHRGDHLDIQHLTDLFKVPPLAVRHRILGY